MTEAISTSPNCTPTDRIYARKRNERATNEHKIIEKCYDVPVLFCFLDYTKAFDKWYHLWTVLQEMAVSKHLIWLIKNLYTKNKVYIRMDDLTSQEFIVSKK